MSNARIFNGVVFTNHALERLTQRQIQQGDAWATLNHPNSSRKSTTKGAWVFYRTYGKRKIEVVASKNERGQWVVLSVWDKPAESGQSRGGFSREPIWRRVIKELWGIFRR